MSRHEPAKKIGKNTLENVQQNVETLENVPEVMRNRFVWVVAILKKFFEKNFAILKKNFS